MALDVCFIAIIFNFFILELLVYQDINFANQVKSPLGIDMKAVIWANNGTTVIPGSTDACSNTYDCSQKLCLMKKNFANFNIASIMPYWDAWDNDCNATVYDNFYYVFDKYRHTYLINVCVVSGTFIFTIICKFFTKSIIILILPTLYVLSVLFICATLILNIIHIKDETDYLINGMIRYQLIHNILFLAFYCIISLAFIGKMFLLIRETVGRQTKEKEELSPLVESFVTTNHYQ